MSFRADHLSASPGCAACTADLHHCHDTLVLHADGTASCDGDRHCEAREDAHDWWVSCIELGCGCTGDEQHAGAELLAA